MTDYITLFPSYYLDFNCIADKCKHTCCAGWEIDIDEDTLSMYMEDTSFIGDKIRKNIKNNSFCLTSDKRCPFLNKNNLCELILNKGEDYLCNICSEHPRFYNYRGRIEEVGIGLCCEEAARIVLSSDDNGLIKASDSPLTEEELFFIERRENLVAELVRRLEEMKAPSKSLFEKFLLCEKLDSIYSDLLDKANKMPELKIPSDEEYIKASYNLVNYLVYRYSEDLDESYISNLSDFVLDFVNLSGVFYYIVANKSGFDINVYSDIVRMISSEIEYSDVNPSFWLKN